MGWLGTLFVGAIVGLSGSAMQGHRRARQWGLAALLAAVCALVVKMLGNITGLFEDGASIEWLASVFAAILSVTVLGMVRRR